MPSAYQPSPCRRCGGPKNRPKQVHRTFWYCAPCERETNRRDQQKADAMLRGNNARLGVVERQG